MDECENTNLSIFIQCKSHAEALVFPCHEPAISATHARHCSDVIAGYGTAVTVKSYFIPGRLTGMAKWSVLEWSLHAVKSVLIAAS
jgi:hypothetical protein